MKDHSVSGENFELYKDEVFEMLMTGVPKNAMDISHYYESDDYISHTDFSRSLFEKVYHWVRSFSITRKISLIAKYKLTGRLLDIGAGTADFLVEAKRQKWTVTGTEPGEKARSIALGKGIALADSTENLLTESFDVITMWHVFEHVSDPFVQIRELKRLIKTDGVIVIAVPNFKSYDARHYGGFWAGYDVPRHLWHYSSTSIQKLFEQADMEVSATYPMWFDAFYVSLLSEKYKSGKMRVIPAIWTGIKSNLKALRSKQASSHIYIIKNKQKIQ